MRERRANSQIAISLLLDFSKAHRLVSIKEIEQASQCTQRFMCDPPETVLGGARCFMFVVSRGLYVSLARDMGSRRRTVLFCRFCRVCMITIIVHGSFIQCCLLEHCYIMLSTETL